MPAPVLHAQPILFVLGMHRSGTSALAGALTLLGADAGRTLLEARPDNPKGFFENRRVVELDDRILAHLRFTHEDPRPLPAGWWQDGGLTDHRAEAAGILADEFTPGRLWVVKDPRISRLLPFWLDVVRESGMLPVFAQIIRHPAEVVASLASRNAYSAERSALLWLQHALDTLAVAEAYPRALISYDRLLADPQGALRPIVEMPALSGLLSAPDSVFVRTFLDPQMRHHSEAAGVLPESAVGGWCRQVYGVLRREDGRTLVVEPAALAALRRPLANYLETCLPWLEEGAGMRAHIDALDGGIRDAWAVVDAKERVIAGERSAHAEATARWQVRLDDVERERQATQTALAAQQEANRLAEARLAAVVGERDVVAAALREREARMAGLHVELDAARGELAALHPVFRAEAVALAACRSDLAAKAHDIGVLQQQAADRERLIAAYLVERSTFCATLMRVLSRWRLRLLPAGTLRGEVFTLLFRFFAALYYRGWRETVRQSWAYALDKFRRRLPQRADAVAARATTMPEYARWIAANEPSDAELDQQRAAAETLRGAPRISVILPIYKVPAAVLAATVHSLQAQTYPHWEACIAYADVDNVDNWRLLQELAAGDARFLLRRLESNEGISGNSDAALAMAGGDFVALLDHDDELAPWALYEMAARIAEDPEIDFLYSDKDCIDEAGGLRLNPLFKPTWSPEMLYSVNYLTHLCVLRRSLVVALGGWRRETDGAQDWDIFLRVAEQARKIVRVVGVHYHWRILPTSVATGLEAKPYALLGQLRTQEERLRRLGLPAWVAPNDESGFRLHWRLESGPQVDLVIDGEVDDTRLASFLQGLRGDAAPLVRSLSIVRPRAAGDVYCGDWGGAAVRRLAFDASAGKAAAMCEAVAAGAAPVLLFLDARLVRMSADCVHELTGWARLHPDIAFVGGVLLTGNDVVVEAGRVCGNGHSAPLFRDTPLRHWGWFGGPLWFRNVSGTVPTAVAFKRQDWAPVAPVATAAGWPETFLAQCLQACARGRRGMIDPHARAYLERMPEGDMDEWDDAFAADPYFHPAFASVSPLRLREG